MNTQWEPLTVFAGVTGHRHIAPEHTAALEAQARQLLLAIRAQYPRCQIAVLSPLADGADSVCARAALKTGGRLIVSLPMDEVGGQNAQGNPCAA